MYAHDEGKHFMHVGEKRWVELHYINKPIVLVRVEIDEHGEYWGWLDSNKDKPCMIWPSEIQFKMCFPYGYTAEENIGRGKAVRLKITKME